MKKLQEYRGVKQVDEGPGLLIDLALFVSDGQPVSPTENWLKRLDPELAKRLFQSAEERELSRFEVYFSHLDESAIEFLDEYEKAHGELPYIHSVRLSDSLCRPPVAPPEDANPIVKSIYQSRLAEYEPPELVLKPDFSNAPGIKSVLDWIRENYLEVEKLAALADPKENTK